MNDLPCNTEYPNNVILSDAERNERSEWRDAEWKDLPGSLGHAARSFDSAMFTDLCYARSLNIAPLRMTSRNYDLKVKVLVSFVLLTLLATSAQAQSAATYAGEFMQLGVGARSMALGGAGVAISNDVTAGYFNPAGLTSLIYPGVAGQYETRFDGTVRYNYGGFGAPLGSDASIGLSVFNISIPGIKDTRNALIDLNQNGKYDDGERFDTSKVKTFSNYDWGVYFSYAKSADSQFSYGASAKLLIRKLEENNSAVGFGFDIGARYLLTERVVLAANLQDVTTTLLSYTTGTKELVTPTLKLGAAYHFFITEDGYHRIIPTIDADLKFDNRGDAALVAAGPISADLHLGAEYRFGDAFAIRGGYSDQKALTFGAGVKLPKLNVDYAFMSFNDLDQLGNTHRISFAFTFEQEKWKR